MRQFISAALLLFIGQVALCQEAVDEGVGEQVATSSEAYDVQLFATTSEGDSIGLISFELSDEHLYMDTGEFEVTESSESYIGSWFGFSWGPLMYRVGAASSESGDNLMLSSLTFGEVLIGRALTVRSDSYEHYFVFGIITDDSAIHDEDDPPSDEDDPPSDEDKEPADEIPAEDLRDVEAALGIGAR